MHANFAQVKNISCVAVSSAISCLGDARVLKFVGAYLDWKYYSNDSRFRNDRPFRDGLVYVLF
jgi:hypothetical protein